MMRQTLVRALALAAVVSAGAVAHASAAPLTAAPLRAQAAAADRDVVNVQYRGRYNHYDRRYSHRRSGFWPGAAAGAIVGAATAPLWAFGGYGYAGEPVYRPGPYSYNRYSGQFQGCVIDDGYGRTRPCSSGSGA